MTNLPDREIVKLSDKGMGVGHMVVAWNKEEDILGGLICKLYLDMHLWYQTKKYSV